MDSLVFSHFVYGFRCIWTFFSGPSLSVNLLHCITCLHNGGVLMTSGLYKYDHVSHYRFVLVGSLLALLFSITHLSLCMSSTGVITACC